MLLFLGYLFCFALLDNKTFAGAWVQDLGSVHFEHSFSGYFGSRYSSLNNTKRLEFLIKSIEILEKKEHQVLSETLRRKSAKANLAAKSSTPSSPAIAAKYRKYRDQEYLDHVREDFAKMWRQDKKRLDVIRKLLYKSVPRYHYHCAVEYGVTEQSTLGCKFLWDRFQSPFLGSPDSFCVEPYWRRKLFESDTYVFSVQPYGQIKYCKALSGGIGVDLLAGYSKSSHKEIGSVKFRKNFRNHSVGLYFPYEKYEFEDAEFKTENTIGKELDSGFGFYAQHFWTHSVSFTGLAAPFSCHCAQTSVYKKSDKYTFSLGLFVEHTRYKDVNDIISSQRFYPRFEVRKKMRKQIPLKGSYDSIKKVISDKKLFNVFNIGISGSISWHF